MFAISASRSHTLLSLTLLIAVPAAGQTPPTPLPDSELVAAGVAYHADTAALRRLLGAPSEVGTTYWRYTGLTIVFDSGKVDQLQLATSLHATRRGLRVGDAVIRFTELYGAPCSDRGYQYCSVAAADGLRGIMAEARNGRIILIRVGTVFGGE